MALNIIKIPSKSIPKKTYRETIFSQIKAYSFCVFLDIVLKYYLIISGKSFTTQKLSTSSKYRVFY